MYYCFNVIGNCLSLGVFIKVYVLYVSSGTFMNVVEDKVSI